MKARIALARMLLGVAAACFAAAMVSGIAGQWIVFGPALIGLFAALGLYSMGHPTLRYYAFTIWVFAFVAASMVYPQWFMTWGGMQAGRWSIPEFDLKILIVPLIQMIMFGMGTTLSVADFARVFKMPWPVFIGLVAQFLIMPLTGLVLARTFGFEATIAAGVVLIGCCPSGVASNVMCYLGRGDVALSVTVTSCTTLVSPLMTPLLMSKLGGQYLPVPFMPMMLEIINMIIVPIVAGLIANHILYSRQRTFRSPAVLAMIAIAGMAAAVLVGMYAPTALVRIGDAVLPRHGLVLGLLLIGVVSLAKLIVDVWLRLGEKWMDRALPVVSMISICYIIGIITARSSRDLLSVGPLLLAAVMIHNAVGYFLGYWMARACRLNEAACRAVSFEVGMQNGGMASALAMRFFAPPAALAPAIFGPWMNVSGSILATWWKRRPLERRVVPIPPPQSASDRS